MNNALPGMKQMKLRPKNPQLNKQLQATRLQLHIGSTII